ncbi:MAG TPA: DUF167 domain-containing protein [Vicinamibacteria bacterium]|nr:DUF167 domain-containing protein [Vicinamibacteria bacterium]
MRDARGGAALRVRVQPRARRAGVTGIRDGALVVRVSAPPVEGAANAELVQVIARLLGVAPGAVEVLRGATGRDKVLHVAGLAAGLVRERLAAVVRDAGP